MSRRDPEDCSIAGRAADWGCAVECTVDVDKARRRICAVAARTALALSQIADASTWRTRAAQPAEPSVFKIFGVSSRATLIVRGLDVRRNPA